MSGGNDVIGRGVVELEVRDDGVQSGIARVEQALDGLGAAGDQAGVRASRGVSGIGDGATAAGGRVDAATRSMIASIQRTTATMEVGSRTSAEYYRALAAQRGVDVNALKPYLEQLDAVNARHQRVGMSAGELSNAMRTLPAQFTDIATSLAGGQDPMLVFLQQGGQLKDMFGGAGPAARAMGQYLLGLVNPFTVAAASAAVLAYGYQKGSREAQLFSNALVATNNAAGASSDHLMMMAASMDAYYGTQAAAAESLTALVATGRVSAGNLERFASVSLQWSDMTGEAIEDVVSKFDELGKDPVEASLKLDESLRFLTASVYDQITALVEQGKQTEAADLAQNALADTLARRTAEMDGNLGIIERGWIAIKKAIKEAGDELLAVGRKQTAAEQLAEINRKLATGLASENGRDPRIMSAAARQALELQKAGLESDMRRLAADVQRDAEREGVRRKGVSAVAELNRLLESGATKAQKMGKELAELHVKAADAAAAGKAYTPAEIASLEAAIRSKYKEPTRRSRSGLDGGQSALASVEADIVARQREIDLLYVEDGAATKLTATQQKLLEVQEKLRLAKSDAQRQPLEAQRAALERLVSVEAELTAQRKLRESGKDLAQAIEASRQAEIDQVATRVASLRGESEQMREQIAVYGMTALEIARLNVTRAEEALVKAEATGASEGIMLQLREELRLRRQMAGEVQQLGEMQRDGAIALNGAIDQYVTNATNAAQQVQSVFGAVSKGMEDSLTQFFMAGKLGWENFASSVVEQIIRIQMQKAVAGLVSSVANYEGFNFDFVSFHTGGVVGQSAANARISADPSIFAAAPRYHVGGLAGLKPGEVPAILQEGEEILTRQNPRHIANLRGLADAGQQNINLEVDVNLINQSSQPVAATKSQPRFDGRRMIIDVVLEDLARGGLIRSAIKGVL